MEQSKTYWYRVGLRDTNDVLLTKSWTQFSMVDPFLITNTTSFSYDDHAVVDVRIDAGKQSPTHQLRFEYGDLWDMEPRKTTEPTTITGDAEETLRFRFEDLPQNAYTKITAVVTNKDDKEVWRSTVTQVLLPGQKPYADGPHVMSIDGRTAQLYALAFIQSYGTADAYVEYTADPDDPQAIVRGEPTRVTNVSELNETLTGLTPGTRYRARVVIVPLEQEFANGGDAEFPGDWVRFSSDAAKNALGNVTIDDVTRDSANIGVPVTPGDFDRDVHVEYTADPDLDDTLSTDLVTVAAADGPRTLSFPVAGLATGTAYWYRAVSTIGEKTERSEWQRFTTAGRPGAKLAVTVGVGPVKAGKIIRVTGSGLEAGEDYRFSVGGVAVATDRADAAGRVSQSVTVPDGLAEGRHALVLTGAGPGRTGSTTVTVVRAKNLSVRVAKKKVKRGKVQKILVRGLAPGEQVRVTVAGKRVSPAKAKANTKGVYRVRYRVKAEAVKQRVVVRGLDGTRTGKASYQVRR